MHPKLETDVRCAKLESAVRYEKETVLLIAVAAFVLGVIVGMAWEMWL